MNESKLAGPKPCSAITIAMWCVCTVMPARGASPRRAHWQRRGAAALVLRCTEIPLALDAARSPLPLIDATAALARRAVAWARQAS